MSSEALPSGVKAACFWFAFRHLDDQENHPLQTIFFDSDIAMNQVLNEYALQQLPDAKRPKAIREFRSENAREGYAPRYFPDDSSDFSFLLYKHGLIANVLTPTVDFLRELDQHYPPLLDYSELKRGGLFSRGNLLFSGEGFVLGLHLLRRDREILLSNQEEYEERIGSLPYLCFGRGEGRYLAMKKMGLKMSQVPHSVARDILVNVFGSSADRLDALS